MLPIKTPTESASGKASGDGWILELKDGYSVQKEEAGNNYVLTKK